ncbi:hypothetical protein BDV26DRAFT_275152 [Aspergillus bertholletiae]|uniref:Transmembrane protein n=1 Tax=Aspergillus bertholletiae TaxID=1226010 RepID=A0A5N7ARG5_9EURO|nr:hypothetical protein BDV26DRAFT_275152 [Aspergillus bertholletiae]
MSLYCHNHEKTIIDVNCNHGTIWGSLGEVRFLQLSGVDLIWRSSISHLMGRPLFFFFFFFSLSFLGCLFACLFSPMNVED